jgi:hypothetical protein
MRQAATIASIAPMAVNLRALSKSLLDAGVTSVGLVWQPPPGSQDGFGEDYGVMENTGFVLTRPIYSRVLGNGVVYRIFRWLAIVTRSQKTQTIGLSLYQT